MNKTKNLGVYIVLQIISILFFPLISLVLSILKYKEPITIIFFVLFAFRYGYIVDCHQDLEKHYFSLLRINDIGLLNAFSDQEVLNLGLEPYHIFLKYFVSIFTLDSRFFAGISAAVYALCFSLFIRQYSVYLRYKMTIIQILLLSGMVFTVEWQWYFGVRFWMGVFFFFIFYSKYLLYRKRESLALSFLCIFFHFALLPLPILAVLAEFLKNKVHLLYFLTMFSLFFRTLSLNIYSLISKVPFINVLVKQEYLSESKGEYSQQFALEFRSFGNVFYQNRIHVLFLSLLLCCIILWRKNKKFYMPYNNAYSFVLLLICISNFGYSNLTFYDRFSKITVLLLFSLLFILSFQNKNHELIRNKLVFVVLFLSVFYALITTVVMLRHRLYDMDLFFSNVISFFFS